MDKLDPPSSLNFDENLAEQWKIWRQELELYLTATESDTKSDKIKTSILLTCIGKRGREIYNTFTWENVGDSLKFNIVIEKFKEYCNPRTNVTFLRYKFFTYKKVDGQSFDEFVTELKKRSAECQFGTLKDELVRDIIICGLADNRLRERLLRDPGLTLEKTIELGQAAEETKRHMKEMHHDSKSVDSLNRSRPSKGARKKVSSSKNKSNRQEEIIAKCKFCAGQHKRGQCPAYNKRCNNCQKLNHFAKCCTRPKLRTIKHVDADSSSEDESESEFFIGSIQATEEPSEIAEIKEPSETEVVHDSACQDEDVEIFAIENYTPGTDWSMNLETNGSDVTYKLDTGAQANVMPKSEYLKLIRKPKLKVTRVKLTAYSGSSIPVLGKCILRISHKKRMVPIMFIVADTNSPPILGLNTCEKLNLIKRVMVVNEDIPEVVKEFSDCFGEMGTLPKVHHIHVDPDIKPVVHPPRRVPIALHAKLKSELDRMESLGVIDRVTEPTDWVNSLVVVQKPNGQIRVCLDPKDLNKAIKRHHYQLPMAEDILSRMSGAKFFSKLDASSGYWQICVDKESSKLLTFNSPFGRYKFNRLPFGVHHASEAFQADVAEILEGIEGVQNAQDDIII